MADSPRFTRHMSDEDALMWHIEKDPILRSTIVAVALFDRPPDFERLRARHRPGDLPDPALSPARAVAAVPPRSAALVGRVDLRPRLPPPPHAPPGSGHRAHAARRAAADGVRRIRPRPAAVGVHADRGPLRRRRHRTRRVRDEGAPHGDRRRRRHGAARAARRPDAPTRPSPTDTPAGPRPSR